MFSQDEQRQLVADRAQALRRAARPGRRIRRRNVFGLFARH